MRVPVTTSVPPRLESGSLWREAVNLGPLIVAVCALFLTVYQARLSYEQQHLSVRPVIHVDLSWSETQAALSFSNRGIGPAEVKALTLTLDGKNQFSWSRVLREIGASPESNRLEFARYPTGTFYPPGFSGNLVKTDGVLPVAAIKRAFDSRLRAVPPIPSLEPSADPGGRSRCRFATPYLRFQRWPVVQALASGLASIRCVVSSYGRRPFKRYA
jgi:hypothetical protein